MSTSYPDSVQFLYALGNEYKTIKFGLERITTLLAALGNPHQACRFIHVAGTNGKGSTCAMLESVLRQRAQGPIGLFTSPHLVEPTERIRIQGQQVPAVEFASLFDEVHEAAESLVSSGGIDMHPTYFETITAMAFLGFARAGVDTAVLETGMGGRLDSTNVVDPLLSVITPVDFDHEKFLGDTLPKIAFEKAGILKPARPAVIALQRPEALAVIEQRAREIGAPLIHASAWRTEKLHEDAEGSRFIALHGGDAIPVDCPLLGTHQVENAVTAVAALHQLGVSAAAIHDGIQRTRWPGRLERVRRCPDVFLDGAHNPAGAAALARYIREFLPERRIWMVFGAMQDKNLDVIGPLLFPLANEIIFTTPGQTRAYRADQLPGLSGETRARVIDSPREALDAALSLAARTDAIFVTGSLYLVGEIRPCLVQ